MQAAQIIHAAGESAKDKIKPGTYAVALHAQDEDHLEQIAEYLADNCVRFTPIVESSAPYSGQLMALGLKPNPRNSIAMYVSQLPLVK